jgi:DNA-binding MarR family transcriptional regulator
LSSANRAPVPKRRFPETPDFVGRYVREAFTHLMNDMNAGLEARYPDVTPAQARIMTLLDREGMRIGDLAARAQLTKQSCSELVVGMEALGLVERRPDPADGRAKLVVPTRAGVAAMVHGLEVAQAIHARWTELIGAREMATLMRSLGRLVRALEPKEDPGG